MGPGWHATKKCGGSSGDYVKAALQNNSSKSLLKIRTGSGFSSPKYPQRQDYTSVSLCFDDKTKCENLLKVSYYKNNMTQVNKSILQDVKILPGKKGMCVAYDDSRERVFPSIITIFKDPDMKTYDPSSSKWKDATYRIYPRLKKKKNERCPPMAVVGSGGCALIGIGGGEDGNPGFVKLTCQK